LLNRRNWFRQVAAGVGSAAANIRAQPVGRPNLLFLFSDQQSSDMLGCYGNEQIETPHLDRFASQSIRFRHSISNSPVCTPYRGILMSGQHGLYTGAISNDYQMVPGGGKYFGEVLRDAGYRTGYIGKWHLYGGDRKRPIPPGPYRYGFDQAFLSNNCTLEFRAGKAWYWDQQGNKAIYDDWEPYAQARQASAFLDQVREPFALFVSWHPPHSWPNVGSYGAPDDLLARYDPAKLRLRPGCEDSPEARKRYQGHMAMCSSVDIAFGRILDRLASRGLDANTIVVYASDHGDMLFSRGSRMEKGHPTADSCRVPLLVRWPEHLKPGTSDLLVSTLDLMPTLLGMMGIPAPRTCQGRDLSQPIRDRRDDAVESVPLFLQVADRANWRGVYTRRYTYSFERPDSPSVAPDRFNRLYDRERDPHELNNLFDSPQHRGLRDELHRKTKDWMARFHDTHEAHTTIARAILEDPAEAKLPALGGPGRSGKLKGRPIDMLARSGAAVLLLCLMAARVMAADPAQETCVRGEQLQLSAQAPKQWNQGTVPRAMAAETNGRIPPPGAFDARSLVIRKGDDVLVEGKDYLVDKDWGTLGIGPQSRVKPADTVSADYCFSLRRIDSKVRLQDGSETVIMGKSRITRPYPPDLPEGAQRIANIFVPYFSDGANADVFPVEETPAQAATATAPGRIPETVARLRSGKPVKIVCWGDSVTVGGDASSPETRYVAVFEKMLRQKFPASSLTVETVAVGGSNSRQWLYPEKFHHANPQAAAGILWNRVLDAKPNLVTIEFVNDAGMKPDDVATVYADILRRLRAIGAEVILITPHFTRMEMMGFQTLRDRDHRPYVIALREFAERNHVAIADASGRWEHLWKEGIPYVTLLNNGINHPDDRGHRIFAEELLKCFEP
jgi:arylsulfatase A-like enzyme/lysophospholipase L1-like esterase